MAGQARDARVVSGGAAEERQRLLIVLAESLRSEGRSLPSPRSFTAAEIKAWIEEDERDLAEYRHGS